jgi:PAS domain S-box-containing protein
VFALGVDGTAFYLICAFFGLAMLGMAANEWRRLGTADYGRIAMAAGVLVMGRIAGAGLLLTGQLTGIACLEGLLQSTTLTAFTWSFLFSTFSTNHRSNLYLALATGGVVGSLLWCLLAYNAADPEQFTPWSVLLLLLSGFALLQWTWHQHQLSRWLAAAFTVSILAAVCGLFGLYQVAALLYLATLPLFAIETYRLIITDLSAYGVELQTVSERALQQTQDLAFLLQVSQAIASSLDLPTVLERVSKSIARAVNADWAYVLLPGKDGCEELIVAARYGWWGSRWTQTNEYQRQIAIQAGDHSLLQHALLRRRQVLANQPEDYQLFDNLHERIGRPQSGPTLVQPIHHQNRTLGAMLLGHSRKQQTFSKSDARLCQLLMAQVATAIDNARLYQSVDEQARALAKLLRVSEEVAAQRQAILESIAEGVVVATEGGKVVLANAAAERILNTSREQLLGKTIQRLYTELLTASGRKIGKLAVFEWGNKTVMGSLAPVRMPDGALLGYVAVFRDVTREREAEQAKSRFIATVSHELRTPMTSIKGYVELLTTGAGGDMTGEQRQFLEVISDNTNRMVSLVNNLIAASEMEQRTIQIQPRPVDMEGIIQDAVKAAQSRAAERQLDLVVSVQPHLHPAHGDPLQLRQIMDQLLDNALRFTPARGHITIWATEVNLENGQDSPQRFLVIGIRDTGVGIPPEEHSLIFEKFYRVKNPLSVEAGGSGMGLAIVKSLVEAHGGRVWVESKVGEGSAFSFVIPTTKASEGQDMTLPGDEPASP